MNRYIRGLCGNDDIAFIIVDTTELVGEGTSIHKTSSVASAAFGRTLTAVGLMSLFLKGEKSSVSLQIKGSNLIQNIFTYGDSKGQVKGYITTPDVGVLYTDEGKLDVGFAVGNHGMLTVIRDFGYGTPYIGQAHLVSGEIAEDLAAYYMYSEQQPCVIALGVHVNSQDSVDAAGGLMIQTLPDVSEESIDGLERRIANFEPITSLLLEGLSLEACLERYFQDFPYKILGEGTLTYGCDCSKDKTSKALLSLGELDLTEMIESRKPAELNCHFCKATYLFETDELVQLLLESKVTD